MGHDMGMKRFKIIILDTFKEMWCQAVSLLVGTQRCHRIAIHLGVIGEIKDVLKRVYQIFLTILNIQK